MLDKVFEYMANRLEEYLAVYYEHPEGLVKTGWQGGEEEDSTEGKIVLTLLNIERESAAGMKSRDQMSGKEYLKHQPPLHVNLYWVLAASFRGEKYMLGLKLLGYSLLFFQQYTTFSTGNIRFTIEPVSLDLQELANVWSVLGGQYYPSMVYKLRMLTLAGEEIGSVVPSIRNLE